MLWAAAGQYVLDLDIDVMTTTGRGYTDHDFLWDKRLQDIELDFFGTLISCFLFYPSDLFSCLSFPSRCR